MKQWSTAGGHPAPNGRGIGFPRTAMVGLAAALTVMVAEVVALVIVLQFEQWSPGCGSGGSSLGCGHHPSDLRAAVYVVVLVVLVWAAVSATVALGLGGHARRLGSVRVCASALLLVALPAADYMVGKAISDAGHDRPHSWVIPVAPSWLIPLTVDALLLIVWVIVVRWSTNRRMGDRKSRSGLTLGT